MGTDLSRGQEQPKNPHGVVPSRKELDAMSEEELSRALEEAFDSMTDETYDDDIISAYLEALDRKDPIVNMPDVDKEISEFWNGVSSAIPPEFIRAAPPKKRTGLRRIFHTGLVPAIMVPVLFGVMVAAQAAGVGVFGAVARWTEETFHFNVSGADGSTAWFADYQEELDAAGLSEEYLPTWVPEGYEATDLQIQELNKSKDIYILYSGENGTAFDLLISIYNEAEAMEQHIFEKDDTPVQTIQAGDKTIYLIENLGLQSAVCQNGNVIYSLTGNLSQNSIEDIFTSIGDG